jgi:5-oxoprolinase (ATP-hydrolysing)
MNFWGEPMTELTKSQAGKFQVAFDIGGTFTDFVLLDATNDSVRIHKALTVPSDPAAGAMAGLKELLAAEGVGFADVAEIIHGSTLVTNCIIERKGAPTALLTTKGFRDVIEFGTEQRYDVHDLFLRFPEPLVERAWRLEVTERISAKGDVLTPIDLEEVRALLTQAVAAGIQAVAVVFLHSYRNSVHERAVADFAKTNFPQLHVSISSEVCGEIREYERSITTVANAYAQPLVDPYVCKLEAGLSKLGFRGRLYLVQSSGTLASPEMARRLPIRLLESGPAGGGLAAAHFGRSTGRDDVIAFDMGGTTAKVCLIQNGKPDIAAMMEAARESRFRRGSGLPIRAPVIDMIEIGAGGGSIAQIDETGLLKVGPRSAGAQPGPAAYGRGGTQPTVTDANLLLGYLGSDSFLGGRMKLDEAAAEKAFTPLAQKLGRSVQEAAWSVFALVCENMAGAARVHVVEKGRDPRNFAMVAFGGAGPAHAVRIAKALRVGTVIIPPASGAASAFGFLGAPVAHEAVRSAPAQLLGLNWEEVGGILTELEQEGRNLLSTADVNVGSVTVAREAEARLSGQVHSLRIGIPPGRLDKSSIDAIKESFARAYHQLYSREPFGGEIEIISWRVTCASPAAALKLGSLSGTPKATEARKRRAWFPEINGFTEAMVYSRYHLQPGLRIVGPAIIEESEATTVIPPGDHAEIDAAGNLIITINAATAVAIVPDERAPAHVARKQIDSVDLEMMWSRLVSISEECWLTVIRTAFSLIIGEAQDFACEILDAEAQSLAHSPRAMPVFNITLMSGVNAMLAEYPADTLKPGDILITNDPWYCAGHLFDVAIVTPVFYGGVVVGFLGSVGHVSDIGGTKNKSAAREIFEEGLQIPPMKLYRAGIPNEDVFRFIKSNVRNPEQVIGDIEALVAANALGASRLVEFMDEYRLADLKTLSKLMHERAERAAREAVRAIPDGVYYSTSHFNSGPEKLWIPTKLTVADDSIEVDFEGCPGQLPQGAINCTLSVTKAETLFALKCLLTPGVRATAGCYRPFTIKAPEHSLLNSDRPASVSLRRLTLWYIVGNIFRALGDAIPDQVQAFTALPTLCDLYGRDSDGATFTDHLFLGGGQGGSGKQDGKTGMLWPTAAANTSLEMVESRIPILILEKSIIQDSAGPGRHRGGYGQRVTMRRLNDDGLPVFVNVYPEGNGVSTEGLHGGQKGGWVRAVLSDATSGAKKEYEIPTMVELKSVSESIQLCVGGGAGFGDPRERSHSKLAAEVANGYLTSQGAAAYDLPGSTDTAGTTPVRMPETVL